MPSSRLHFVSVNTLTECCHLFLCYMSISIVFLGSNLPICVCGVCSCSHMVTFTCAEARKRSQMAALSLSVLYSREMGSLELGWYPVSPVTLLLPSSTALGLEVDISDHAQVFT